MIALRRSTTYAGKFGQVPNPKEPYEPPRARSAVQTEQVASIKKRRGGMTRTDLSEIARGIPLAVILLALATIAVIVFL